MTDDLVRAIEPEVLEEAREVREDLHRHPELAFEERRTASVVAEKLRSASLDEVVEGVAGTGVVGLLRGGKPGGTVALRADMDALPIQEKTNLPYASQTPGVMHACGHDGHTAVLLGAARVLAGRREALAGGVKFLFQPAEEKGNGARKMVEAGVLHEPEVVAIFALHARPQIPLGRIELDPQPSAATNGFEIRVVGKGCHAAYPHLGIDPIAIGCQMVSSLQQVVSRRVAPFDAAVVTVGSFHAGDRGNVIPEEAVLRGTIRARDPDVQRKVIDSVRRLVEQTAAAFGAGCELRVEPGCPRVRNHPRLLDLVRRVGSQVLGAENVLDAAQATMGGEDFAFYLEEQGGVPGCLFRLGVETDELVHTASFDFGNRGLDPGIRMMTNIAIRYLSEDNQPWPRRGRRRR